MEYLIIPLARLYHLSYLFWKARKFFFWSLGIVLLTAILSIFIGSSAWSLLASLLILALRVITMLAMAIGQFVAIFWFMSRTRVFEVRPGDPKSIGLEDYRGQPGLVKMMNEWMQLISGREDFARMGGRKISGIMLTGGPGTGKTYLARALAGGSGIAFIGLEASSLRGMFWGIDSLKVAAFFRKARALAMEYSGCIAYIDELDAVGMARSGMGGSGQTTTMGLMGGTSGALTRLLYEMDGLEEFTPWQKALNTARLRLGFSPFDPGHVLVMAATNVPHLIDIALKRPGRFDRIIEVNLPDRTGRLDILHYYLGTIKNNLDEREINILADDTGWATPVHIASAVTKDAVRLALFAGRDRVTLEDIEMALQEQAMGIANPISDLTADQKWQLAVHEAGHAVAQYHLRSEKSRIVRLSIVRRGGALGYMLPVPKYDVYTLPLIDIVRDIVVSLGGHVATELVLGEPWTGASTDFEHVRMRLNALLYHSAFGAIPLGNSPTTENSEKIEAYFLELKSVTYKLLERHRPSLETLAKALMERQDMNGEEVVAVLSTFGGPDESTQEILTLISDPAS